MNNKILLVFLFLIATPLVFADYNIWTQYGSNSLHTRNFLGTIEEPYNLTNPDSSGAGSYTEPMLYDFNGDGRSELIMYAGSGRTRLIAHNDLTGYLDEIYTGEPIITPTICDINNDGVVEYVGVFNYSGVPTAISLNTDDDAERLLLQGSKAIGNATSRYANIVCSQFFTGNTQRFAIFLDEKKYLHFVFYNSGLQDTIYNVANSVQKEVGASYAGSNIAWGTSTIALDETGRFDSDSYKALLYTAGNETVVFLADGSSLNTSYITYTRWSVPDQILTMFDGRGNGIITSSTYRFDGSWKNIVLKIREQRNIITNQKELSIEQAVVGTAVGTNTVNSFAIAPYQGTVPALYVLQWNVNPGTLGALYAVRLSNMSVELVASYPNSMSTATTFYPVRGMFFNSGQMYINAYNTSNNTIELWRMTGNYSFRDDLVLTVPSNANQIGLFPLDLDNDGILDFYHSRPAETQFYTSGAALSNSQILYPFTVTQANTSDFTTTQTVTALFNGVGGDTYYYDYTLACDAGTQQIWGEQFIAGYNTTARNVSIIGTYSENYNGFIFIVNSTQPMNVLKIGNEGYRQNLAFDIVYNSPNDNVADLLFTDAYDVLTYWLRLNKTSSQVEIYEVPFDGDPVFVTNLPVSADTAELTIQFEPRTFDNTNQDYFKTIFKRRNVTLDDSNTGLYNGGSIKDIQFYSDSPSTVRFQSFSLSETFDPEKDFVTFQNGQRREVAGVVVETPALAPSFAGDGFTLYPGFNNTFTTTCSYNDFGTYTQRHYMSAGLDWSNYRDLIVTVQNESAGTDFNPTDDNAMTAFFDKIGLSNTGKFIVWTFVSLIFGVIFTAMTGFVWGILSFIMVMEIGYMLGMMPLWFNVVIIIIASYLFIEFYRKFFAENSGTG